MTGLDAFLVRHRSAIRQGQQSQRATQQRVRPRTERHHLHLTARRVHLLQQRGQLLAHALRAADLPPQHRLVDDRPTERWIVRTQPHLPGHPRGDAILDLFGAQLLLAAEEAPRVLLRLQQPRQRLRPVLLYHLRSELEVHVPLVLVRVDLPPGQLVEPMEVPVRPEGDVQAARDVRRWHQLRRLDAPQRALAGVHDARELDEGQARPLAVAALLGAEVVACGHIGREGLGLERHGACLSAVPFPRPGQLRSVEVTFLRATIATHTVTAPPCSAPEGLLRR